MSSITTIRDGFLNSTSNLPPRLDGNQTSLIDISLRYNFRLCTGYYEDSNTRRHLNPNSERETCAIIIHILLYNVSMTR